MPSTTGSTASRCEGLEAIVTGSVAPARPIEVAARALVVLDVAGALRRSRDRGCPRTRAKISLVGLADDVGEDVEPTAVRHPDDRLGDAALGAASKRASRSAIVDSAALEAEALLADVAGVQEALEGLGGVQPLEQVALLFDG